MTRFNKAANVMTFSVSAALAVAPLAATAQDAIDLSKWSPEYVKSIAGTATFDTVGSCAKVVPTDTTGKVSYWYTGPQDSDPEIVRTIDGQFWEAFKAAYPNITTDVQNIPYNDLLDKFRTALLGNAGPMVVRLQILGGVEFGAKGYLQPLKPEDVGYATKDFWPGALKSVTYDGNGYGIPTNNETMAFIYNAKIFKDAGLDTETAPPTWDDVVKYSKIIKDKLGIA
ncbi:MAG: extracellular solute-binding protein, partial [Candidatus Saccharibacteria bacterium]|nr:extracellular solute-binding protein [Pseudorhodobacter sp.]